MPEQKHIQSGHLRKKGERETPISEELYKSKKNQLHIKQIYNEKPIKGSAHMKICMRKLFYADTFDSLRS